MDNEIPPYEDVKHLVKKLQPENGYWIACYPLLGISTIGESLEEVMDSIEVAYDTHNHLNSGQ